MEKHILTTTVRGDEPVAANLIEPQNSASLDHSRILIVLDTRH